MRLKLRDYQQQGISDVRYAFGKGARSVLYVLSTGAGKTVTYAAIAEGAAKKGNKVLILEHRKELIFQASMALARLGIKHRIVAPDKIISAARQKQIEELGEPFIRHESTVLVASVQTLANKLDWLSDWGPDVIVVDEAHHSVAGTWFRILTACPDAIILGVTATPCRNDNRGLGDIYEVMVLGPPPSFLIDEGYLVPPRLIVPPTQLQMDDVHRRSGDWIKSELEAATDRPVITGCAIDHYSKIAPNRPAIAFTVSVKHAKHVNQQFIDAGYSFAVVTGDEKDMGDITRDQAINGLSTGLIHGMSTVDIISEGTDIPVAEVGIMLRKTESLVLWMQQSGRFLRPAYADGFDLSIRAGRLNAIEESGKTHGIILDHVGNYWDHGSPTEDREWTLDTTRPKRKKNREIAERYDQCPKCYAVHDPNPRCPFCGYVYEAKSLREMEQVEGQLVDVTEMDRQRRQAKIDQGKARTLDDLLATGMNKHRAMHIIASRTEKDRLRNDLLKLVDDVNTQLGVSVGLTKSDIFAMTPKPLKEHIDRLGTMLFKGEADEEVLELVSGE